MIAGLWRYPVKSLGGERLDAVAVTPDGLAGDREWALLDADGKIASGKTTRRFRKLPGLLAHTARLGDRGQPVVTLAGGGELPAAEAVAALAGPGWRLAHAPRERFEDDAPVHLVSTATLRALAVEAERLRPNVLLELGDDPFAEDAWIGSDVALGDGVVLHVTHATERCVMVTHARPSLGLGHEPAALKRIGRRHGACAGVYARVVRPGELRVGRP